MVPNVNYDNQAVWKTIRTNLCKKALFSDKVKITYMIRMRYRQPVSRKEGVFMSLVYNISFE